MNKICQQRYFLKLIGAQHYIKYFDFSANHSTQVMFYPNKYISSIAQSLYNFRKTSLYYNQHNVMVFNKLLLLLFSNQASIDVYQFIIAIRSIKNILTTDIRYNETLQQVNFYEFMQLYIKQIIDVDKINGMKTIDICMEISIILLQSADILEFQVQENQFFLQLSTISLTILKNFKTSGNQYIFENVSCYDKVSQREMGLRTTVFLAFVGSAAKYLFFTQNEFKFPTGAIQLMFQLSYTEFMQKELSVLLEYLLFCSEAEMEGQFLQFLISKKFFVFQSYGTISSAFFAALYNILTDYCDIIQCPVTLLQIEPLLLVALQSTNTTKVRYAMKCYLTIVEMNEIQVFPDNIREKIQCIIEKAQSCCPDLANQLLFMLDGQL